VPNKPEPWELSRLEYEAALEQYRQLTSLRRQDMTFVTTVQAAVLTIIGTKLLSLDASGFLLSLIAVFVLFLGVNSERRLSGYMAGYMRRAKEIESEYGMQLLSCGVKELRNKKLLISNSIIFPFYYSSFFVAWVVVWTLNIFR
jgi:type IV secretory pathway VirB3-like protein